jgi:hypothetical protein
MRHSLLLPTVVLAGALGIGCRDQSGVTNPDPGGINPYDGTLSNATEILRFEEPVIIFHGQEDPPITALIGVGLEEFPDVCAGAAPQELADCSSSLTRASKGAPLRTCRSRTTS